jgi:two-component system sensor histidine kinase RegB
MGEVPTSISLADIVNLLQLESARGGASVQVTCDEPHLQVRWPTQAVLQAVNQVIRNAVQASPIDGVVSCHIRHTTGTVCFDIRDSGSGIPVEIQDRLGEPFFTTREAGQGMGLGLFIARSLVQHLGGALAIESRPGNGTRVEIQLPLGAPA